jgi:hypothetical protein
MNYRYPEFTRTNCKGWLEFRGFARGAIVAPQTVYDLGADWYRTRLDVDWEPAT